MKGSLTAGRIIVSKPAMVRRTSNNIYRERAKSKYKIRKTKTIKCHKIPLNKGSANNRRMTLSETGSASYIHYTISLKPQ